MSKMSYALCMDLILQLAPEALAETMPPGDNQYPDHPVATPTPSSSVSPPVSSLRPNMNVGPAHPD